MKSLRIVVPLIITAILTVGSVFLASWMTGLVPEGEWAALIRAFIVFFIVLCILVAIAWSAYFIYIIRTSVKESLKD